MYDIWIKEEIEHEYSENSIPELYRFVYLYDDNNCSLAIRVYDEENEWKFVFDKDSEIIHFPTKWIYPKSNIEEFLNENNKEFTIPKIKEKYPPKKEV